MCSYCVSILILLALMLVSLATILIVGGFKGVIAKRIYKNWPLGVIETAIYYNLLHFQVLQCHRKTDFEGNHIAVAYMFVRNHFHVLRYTAGLYLLRRPSSELDEYQLELELYTAHTPYTLCIHAAFTHIDIMALCTEMI